MTSALVRVRVMEALVRLMEALVRVMNVVRVMALGMCLAREVARGTATEAATETAVAGCSMSWHLVRGLGRARDWLRVQCHYHW